MVATFFWKLLKYYSSRQSNTFLVHYPGRVLSQAWWERCFFGEFTQLQKSKSRYFQVSGSSLLSRCPQGGGTGIFLLDQVSPEFVLTHQSSAGNSTCKRTKKVSMKPKSHSNVKSVLRSSGIFLGQNSRRKNTIIRGHLFVLHATKASSKPQAYTCIRRFMQERNISGAAFAPSLSATETTYWLRSTSTWERSPMCIQSARDATTSHPPTITPWGHTRGLPSDMFPPHQKPPWCNAN